jgi:plasmid maintenance system antidote protein VapI
MADPRHPGALLRKHLEDRELTAAQTAAELGIPEYELNRLMDGIIPLTPTMANRLRGHAGLELDVDKLVNAQRAYDEHFYPNAPTAEDNFRGAVAQLFGPRAFKYARGTLTAEHVTPAERRVLDELARGHGIELKVNP